PAPEGGPIDGGDEDLLGALEGPESAAQIVEKGPHLLLAHGGPLLEVGAGAEGLLPRSGDHHRPKRGLLPRRLDEPLELRPHGARDGVSPGLAVDGPDLDRAIGAALYPKLRHHSLLGANYDRFA